MNWLGLALALLSACAVDGPALSSYELWFRALDDRGDPIAELDIAVGATPMGKTDDTGRLIVSVNAQDGEIYPLQASCPDNHEATDVPTEVVFRETTHLKGATTRASARIEIRIVCARADRVVGLLVHADGHADMPILIDGVPRGRTGSAGFGHIRLDLKPNTEFEVALDSSAHPTLRPQNPRRTMTLGAQDGLFVFDPVFSERVPEVKKKRARRRNSKRSSEPPAPARPVRIE